MTQPYVGAHYEKSGADVTVWWVEAAVGAHPDVEHGRFLTGVPAMTCGDGTIRLTACDFSLLPNVGSDL